MTRYVTTQCVTCYVTIKASFAALSSLTWTAVVFWSFRDVQRIFATHFFPLPLLFAHFLFYFVFEHDSEGSMRGPLIPQGAIFLSPSDGQQLACNSCCVATIDGSTGDRDDSWPDRTVGKHSLSVIPLIYCFLQTCCLYKTCTWMEYLSEKDWYMKVSTTIFLIMSSMNATCFGS